MSFIKPVIIRKEESNIVFRATGVEEMVYKTDVNSFIENSGVTIQNIGFPIYGYYINLSEINDYLTCGNIMDTLFVELRKIEAENTLLVFNFKGVKEVSESFFSSYTKFLLKTNNKIININMNTKVTNGFSDFITVNIINAVEETENELYSD